MRRLWHGEVVFGHDGPAGKYPILHLDATFDEDIPLGLVAFGPNTLALAGPRVRHGGAAHVLHRRDDDARRRRRCGRRPSRPGATRRRCGSGRATRRSATRIPDDLRLKKTVGRLATYLQGYGDLLVRTNGWDPAVLARFRADAVVQSVPGAIDGVADTADARAHRHAPPRRVAGAGGQRAAPRRAPQRVLRQFDLGVDGVIMHGATPAELAPVVDAYRADPPGGPLRRPRGEPRRALTRAQGRIRTQKVSYGVT